jgi:hypothetical protein
VCVLKDRQNRQISDREREIEQETQAHTAKKYPIAGFADVPDTRHFGIDRIFELMKSQIAFFTRVQRGKD